MKTKTKIFIVSTVIAFAALCLGIFFFGGWFDGQKKHPEVEGFSQQELQTIRKAYYEAYYNYYNPSADINEIQITKFSGRYDGVVAFKLYDPYMGSADVFDPDPSVTIDGIYIGKLFQYETFFVYLEAEKYENEESRILPLYSAYEENYLTKENLQQIAAYENEKQ
mgnify:CR=1 FL=1